MFGLPWNMLAIRCVGIAGRWAILGKDVDEAEIGVAI
jgi:hypothetical protein